MWKQARILRAYLGDPIRGLSDLNLEKIVQETQVIHGKPNMQSNFDAWNDGWGTPTENQVINIERQE
jgi:hypothetical protein